LVAEFLVFELVECWTTEMAQQFVGMTVALTLSNNAQIKGTVSKVDSTTQILHLLDGNLPKMPIQTKMSGIDVNV
jgi:hypothetical protein